jgi:chitodextrinase
MFVRWSTFAASLVILVLAAGPANAARKPPPQPTGGPSAPTNLRITAASATSISLAWDASKSSSSNWWYCVQRDGQGCVRVDPPTTTHTRTLWPGTTYDFSVVAIDANGKRSASSNVVTYTTPPDTTPPTAPSLTSIASWPMRTVVSWTRSQDGGTNANQVWYTLLQNGVPHPSYTETFWFGEAMVLDLAPQTTYTFQVRVRDFFGNRAESNVITVTTPATTPSNPPTAPTNLRPLPQSSQGELWLEWDQSTDDGDPQSLILYDVYINGVFGEHVAIGHGSTITYCFGQTGQAEITLRAVDTSGHTSAASEVLLFDC